MIKENKKTKRNVAIIVIGLILVLAVATFSYALWTKNFTETGVNKNIYDCFTISYQETNGTGISIEHGYPQTDEEGMQNNPYEVQIKNSCKTVASYDVILNEETNSTLNPDYLKVATDEDIKLLSSATETTQRVIDNYNNKKSYIINSGVLASNQTKTLQIRSWMDENTSVENGSNKEFAFKITIEATAGDGGLLAGKILKSYPITPDNEMESFDFYDFIKKNQTVDIEVSAEHPIYATSNIDKLDRPYEYGYMCCVRGPNGGPEFRETSDCKENITDPREYVGWYTYGNNDYVSSGSVYKIVEVSDNKITKADIITSINYDVKKGMVETSDDDGTSYVYRGDINNNYISFADKLWRILRINGDGTIRIILNNIEDNAETIFFNNYGDNQKYVGYTYDNGRVCTKANPCDKNVGTSSNLKTYLENWYSENLQKDDNNIAISTYCNDTSTSSTDNEKTNYGAISRLDEGKASLKCFDTDKDYGGVYKLKIGALTADEMQIAGLTRKVYENLKTYFPVSYWWTMTPYYYSNSQINLFISGIDGDISDSKYSSKFQALPVINLKSDVTVTGFGTQSDPYVVQ